MAGDVESDGHRTVPDPLGLEHPPLGGYLVSEEVPRPTEKAVALRAFLEASARVPS